MRTNNTAAALLLILGLSPLRAQTPALSAADACLRLAAQARQLTAEIARCEAGPAGLIVKNVSASGMQILQQKLFPERRYLGHALASEAAAFPAASGPDAPLQLIAAQQQASKERVNGAQAALVNVNFDNSAARSGLNADASVSGLSGGAPKAAVLKQSGPADGEIRLAQGPPGSGGAQQPQTPRQAPPGAGGPPGSGGEQGRGGDQGRGGPPGSQQPPRGGGPPGSQNPPQSGPPGSQNPPQGTPPGNSVPPSRPAPVWRSSFPPPAPNWWNTDFDNYQWWEELPSGYERTREDRSNPDKFFYYSGWYRWRDVFYSAGWIRTSDSASISRTAANSQQVHTRSLTSQAYRDSKVCYYQAVYRYDWVQGGFQGSHWEEHFDHYSARCIRQPREYGQPRVYTSHITFDMSQAQGQELPWESDVIRLTYDGTGTPRYDYSGAAFRYASRVDDQRGGSESVTLIAGPKNLRAPESDKVQAFLRVNAGKVEFVINDDRAQFYRGETLRVSAKIVRRYVYKEKGLLWGWNERHQDSVIYSQPVDILVGTTNPQKVIDLTSQANGAKPANFVRASAWVDSWEFTRVNSRISTGALMRQGRGNPVGF